MIDIRPLAASLALVIGLSVGFAFVSWFVRARAGRRGLIITWFLASILGLAFLALGPATEGQWPKNVSEIIEDFLVPMIVFGAGALVVEASFNQARGGQTPEAPEVRRRFPPPSVVLRVVGAMLLAFGIGFCMSVGSQGEL